MAPFEIRPILAAETRQMRHEILRPHQTPEELVFPGDLDPKSLHIWGFVDGEMVGVASVMPSAMPGDPPKEAWQLRGMAVRPRFRRMGMGRAMVMACLRHVALDGGTLLWCRARTGAVPFYQSLGFQTEGDEFNIPYSGPHFVMWRPITAEERVERSQDTRRQA